MLRIFYDTSEVKTQIIKQRTHLASTVAKTKSKIKSLTSNEKNQLSRLWDKLQDNSIFHVVLFNYEGSTDLSFLYPIKATLSSSVIQQMGSDTGEGEGKAALSIYQHKTIPRKLEMQKQEQVNTPKGGGAYLFFFPPRSGMKCELNRRKDFSPLQLLPG